MDGLPPTEDWYLRETKVVDNYLCEDSQFNQYSVIRVPNPGPGNYPQINFRFYPVPNQSNQYYIQSELKSTACPGNDFLTFDENSQYCSTPCNPALPNSECALWTKNFNRVPIKTTSAALKKAWKVTLKSATTGIFPNTTPCKYYAIEPVATSGCMGSNPYQMTFEDNT